MAAGITDPSTTNPSISTASSIMTTTTVTLRPMPIETKDPEPTPAQGMRQWPANPCIPVVHTADLAAIAGQSAKAKPLQEITIILDAGHGGKDGGTSYPNQSANPELVEKNITLAVAGLAREC
jgi:N-acetylmuramoyl-L-alanine amidase